MSDCIRIAISRGLFAVLDSRDSDLAAYRWQSRRPSTTSSVYAQRSEGRKPNRRSVHLHRVVLARKLGRELLPTELADHVNGDGLDNRRANLRLATRQQNNRNRRPARGSSSRFLGVTWNKSKRRWCAQITHRSSADGRRNIYLGAFKSEEEAARAYDAAAFRLSGEFANQNFGGR